MGLSTAATVKMSIWRRAMTDAEFIAECEKQIWAGIEEARQHGVIVPPFVLVVTLIE